ncbi:MAG: heparinase II/III family protein [Hyphomicrobiales bacterium]|nr:heparinase II/III family protein [Hyphomicrobiales bacterium]
MPTTGSGRSAEARLVGRLLARRLLAPVVRALRLARTLIEPAADRLTVAPQDLRTADPTVADDIYAGVFAFSGQIVECRGRSPFEVTPPGPEWARVLHGFGWLRHLRAADTAVARANARALVDDWLRMGEHPALAWEGDVVARRLLAWLSQAPMILADADPVFYHRFLAGLTRHFRQLRIRRGEEPAGLPRLKSAIAMLACAVTVEGFRRFVRAASRRLDDELDRQILPDGGHVGRNPNAVVEILVDLLPLRQVLAARGLPVSQAMTGAIDRMMPMVRFFRHDDGALALFNGASASPTDLVATIFAYDEAKSRPHGNAPHSGYQRLEASGAVVVMDCGVAPPIELSQAAHAGTLAFELSSGHSRFVVNCGAPFRPIGEWRRLARTTAAHSALVVDDHSSARVAEQGLLAKLAGPVLVAGPRDVPVERREEAFEDEGVEISVTATHDGWRRGYGVLHERSLRLTADGDQLDGLDRILPAPGARAVADVPFVVRFHLHPSIRSEHVAGGIRLTAPNGEAWDFVCTEVEPELEPSVHLADSHGLRRAEQITLTVAAGGPREIAWTFLHTTRSLIPRH